MQCTSVKGRITQLVKESDGKADETNGAEG